MSRFVICSLLCFATTTWTGLWFVTAAIAAPLSPDDSSIAANLTFWLKADAGVTADGSGFVSQWDDQSSSASHVANGTAGRQPTLLTGLTNGPATYNAVSFDRTNLDFLTVTATTPASNSTGGTVFIVEKALTDIGASYPFSFGGSSADRFMLGAQAPDYFSGMRVNGAGSTAYLTNSSVTPVNDGLYVAASHWSPAPSSTVQSILQADGSFSTTSDGAVATGAFSSGVIQLGVLAYQSSIGSDADIAEVIVYDRELSNAEILGVSQYLGLKYGVLELDATLSVDRRTGAMTLANERDGDLDLQGYMISSASGSLDQAGWIPITDNYDSGSGGPVDVDDAWTILSDPSSVTDLSEFQFGGNGGLMGVGAEVSLSDGGAWIPSPANADLTMTILDTSGSPLTVFVEYVGHFLGDMDGNNLIEEADINAFVQALTDRAAYNLAYPTVDADLTGDFNDNGQLDLGDISGFKAAVLTVAAAAGSAASASVVPEPSSCFLMFAVAIASLVRRRR